MFAWKRYWPFRLWSILLHEIFISLMLMLFVPFAFVFFSHFFASIWAIRFEFKLCDAHICVNLNTTHEMEIVSWFYDFIDHMRHHIKKSLKDNYMHSYAGYSWAHTHIGLPENAINTKWINERKNREKDTKYRKVTIINTEIETIIIINANYINICTWRILHSSIALFWLYRCQQLHMYINTCVIFIYILWFCFYEPNQMYGHFVEWCYFNLLFTNQ